MLSGIAIFSMHGRWQTDMAIILLSFATLMLPPLNYLSSGIIMLTILRMGVKEGMRVIVVGMFVLSLIAKLLLEEPYIANIFFLSSWLPVLIATLILGYRGSLAASLLATCVLGFLMILGTHLVLSDPAMWWQQLLMPLIEILGQQSSWQFDQTHIQKLISNSQGIITGLIAAGLSLNVMLGLLLGRSWQATIFNMDNFSAEFCELRLGNHAALMTIILMIISLSPLKHDLSLLVNCLPVMLIVFTLQGLAVVHAIVKRQHKHKLWLIAVYILLIVLLPQMVVLLATLGVLEQWMNFRRYSP